MARSRGATRHYVYRDAAGDPVRQKVIVGNGDDKEVWWEQWTEHGWERGYGTEPDLLYNLPGIVAAVEQDETVTVVEGERDAETLISRGYCATTPPHPQRAWGHAMAAVLHGADVYVYWDNDPKGHQRGWWAVEALRNVAASVTAFHSPRANDLTEHIEQGGTPDTMEQAMPPRVTAAEAAKPYGNGGNGTLTVRKADLSRSEAFKFVWDNRVLMGYFNLMVGEEGIGKGTMFAWVAAQVTRGKLPGDLHGHPRSVLVVGDEDSWDNIWTPRFAAAGADLERCLVVEQMVDVTKDAPGLEDAIRANGVCLTFFDQLLDNLGYADSWKDKDVRQALHPLRRVADATDTAMLASMHPNKKGTASFRDKVSGTPAFNALSRSSLYVAHHPEDPKQVAVVRPKGNYNVDPPAFVFSIDGEVVAGKEGQPVTTSRVVRWHEEQLDKRLVLDGATDDQQTSARQEVEEIIAEYFPPGVMEWPAAEIYERLSAEGITSKNTIRRARLNMGLHTRKNGNGGWHWHRKLS